MKFSLHRPSLLLVFFVMRLICLGDIPSSSFYHLDVWRTDDGLPQGTVTSVVQSPDGYLWLGTQNGLVRFDGVTFKVFNQNNTPEIKNNRIVQLYAERGGALWIGAEQGSLTRYDEGRFLSCAMPGVGSPFNYARAFCNDAAGQLWVATCEWRLMRMTKGASEVPEVGWTIGGVRPNALAADENGMVYMGTDRALAAWNGAEFVPVWSQTNEPGFEVEFLAPAHSGGCWVAGNGRLRRFHSGSWAEDLGAYAWTNQALYGLFEDSRKNVWAATRGGGLFRYSPGVPLMRLTARDGLPTDFVRCVTEDREGNIWFGMEGGGLGRLKPAIFRGVGVQEGLASDQVMSVCEAADGSLWVGLNGRGLDHVVNGRVEHYGPAQGLMNDHVWSVLQDRKGRIWAGTWGGLYRLEAGARFQNISDGTRIGGVVLAIFEDSSNAIWLGQQGIAGVTRIMEGQVASIILPGASPGLDVRAIAEDYEGWIWFGTENEGLYRWKNNVCAHFGKKDGLASESIWSLRTAADGTVWIGTCGGGLSRWRDGRISTWTTQDGLASDVICQILDTEDGNLWLGSYGGVFRVAIRDLERTASSAENRRIPCAVYSRADGLPSIECPGGFQPSGLKSSDGRLWFPTIRGLAVLDSTRIVTNPVPPLVLVEQVVADGSVQPMGQRAIGKPPNHRHVSIPQGTKTIDFHYTASSLTAPDKVRFKYRLDGLEREWTAAEGRRVAVYNRLPPGDYKFRVIACNNDGLWNEQGAVLAVTVQPFFWQTTWFMASGGLALLVPVFASVRFITTRRLKLRLERLEHEQLVDRERTRIAKDIHDDLGASLTEITLLSELAQNPEPNVENAQSDIQRIAAKARNLTQLLDEIVWAVNPQRDSLENFVTYTCTYAEDYLRLAKIHCRLELPGTVPGVPLRAHVRHGLFLVVKEALNNIVKHSGASEVRIRMDLDASRLTIAISDDGCGFDLNGPGISGRVSIGEGLANMRQRIESFGGTIRFSSGPGKGTQVEISVPANQEDL